jgi:hypothetical protein
VKGEAEDHVLRPLKSPPTGRETASAARAVLDDANTSSYSTTSAGRALRDPERTPAERSAQA